MNLFPSCVKFLFRSSGLVRRLHTGPEAPVFLSSDGNYFICWHPEKDIPYEKTLPLPVEEKIEEPLIKNINETYSVFKKEQPIQLVAEECAKLTYTTKHRWFPRARDKRAKKSMKDREYL